MKATKNHDELNHSLVLIPAATLDSIMESQQKILSRLEELTHKKDTVGDFITENEAKQFLGRKTTWFWAMRSSGRLPFSKIGNKIFYSKKDIHALLEQSKSR